MKITEYPSIETINDDDLLVIQTSEGTRNISAKTFKADTTEFEDSLDVVAKHRNTFRGKNLGTQYTDEQKAMVQNGTFDDLYVGDYWNINGITWRIADINNYYNLGPTNNRLEQNHLFILPDTYLYSISNFMDSTWRSDGYLNSKLFKSIATSGLPIIKNAFGDDNLLPFKYLMVATYDDNGKSTSSAWVECKANILSCSQLLGNYFDQNRFTVNKPYDNMIKIFELDPNFIGGNTIYNTVTNELLPDRYVATITPNGIVVIVSIQETNYVRPYFLLG